MGGGGGPEFTDLIPDKIGNYVQASVVPSRNALYLHATLRSFSAAVQYCAAAAMK